MSSAGKPVKQPWLSLAWVDGLFILSPPFLALLGVACFPGVFKSTAAMPLVYWVLLVVMVDVAHVYSTLYRTYFRSSSVKQRPMLLVIPLLCYVAGVLLYAVDGLIFWRVLAYLAVFHFIRQQYGFMRLYSRHEHQSKLNRFIDALAVYTATIYPLLYWHLAGGRQFNWFVDGDFLVFKSERLLQLSGYVYIFIIAAYVVKEIYMLTHTRKINLPRNLIVAGTLVSWYFGIVYYNGDMAFTTLNVISHGIPYMALIWITEQQRVKNKALDERTMLKVIFKPYTGVIIFVMGLVLLAYLEEGLWDGLVWREHTSVFAIFKNLPLIHDSAALALLVPLLSLPQSTHYILDGFIWKRTRQEDQ
jgi:hypothetical protein